MLSARILSAFGMFFRPAATALAVRVRPPAFPSSRVLSFPRTLLWVCARRVRDCYFIEILTTRGLMARKV